MKISFHKISCIALAVIIVMLSCSNTFAADKNAHDKYGNNDFRHCNSTTDVEVEKKKNPHDEIINVRYDKVQKTYKVIKASKLEGAAMDDVTDLHPGKTNVHPINITDTRRNSIGYIVNCDKFGTGKAKILLERKGKKIFERIIDFHKDDFYIEENLKAGSYNIKVVSGEKKTDVVYQLYIRPTVPEECDSGLVYLQSCYTTELNPNKDSGKWSSSNKKIVVVETKKYAPSCVIRGKRKGVATVTFKGKKGYIKRYQVNVTLGYLYPIDEAKFYKKQDGRIEPYGKYANYSDRKIKNIRTRYVFYTAKDIANYYQTGDKRQYTDTNSSVKPWNTQEYYGLRKQYMKRMPLR